MACAAVACLIGRNRTDPVASWVGLAELALARPVAAGAFVVFALSAWAGDLLPVASARPSASWRCWRWPIGATLRVPDRPVWRWSMAGAMIVVALPMAAAAFGRL